MQMQQQDWTPQQQAICELHSRYERGELPFEDFARAIDKVSQAQTSEECWTVLQQLSPSPAQALQTRETLSHPPAIQLSPTQWIGSLIGDVQRIRRPWKVAQQTTVLMGIGDVELD